ncbi:pre-peptidase C-terminal domain-containing protein [Agrococcus sp. Ld7]|uniref:pre-peptidase C-terminal domain-containing protein n=1 Tax=Agrococcus sp. Ld7 TaxID=649148 RepID=UPI00386F1AA6
MHEQLEICIDKQLPVTDIIESSSRAIEEAPENVPAQQPRSTLPGVQENGPLELAILTGKKWATGRTISIGFRGGSASLRAKVEAVAKQWEQHANLTLDFGSDATGDIRIDFAPGGSWSYLGTDALSIPQADATMNYGWLTDTSTDDEIGRVVLHEFGHALSAIHEHQNPVADIPWDKPAVYAYYAGPPNNWSREVVDRNIFQRYSTTVTNHSAFDRDSIMLYAIPNQLTIGDYEVGWNRGLSDTDRAFMATIYPRTAPSAVELTVAPPYTQAAIGAPAEQDLFSFVVADAGQHRVETFGTTDVVMTLLGPDSLTAAVAEDDDGGAGPNAAITAQLAPGRYYARVRHYSATGSGTYEIGVRRIG